MIYLWALISIRLLGASFPSSGPAVPADSREQQIVSEVGFDQRLGAQMPLDATFRDENGRTVRLADYLNGGHPAILVLGYYQCPMLCSLVLNGLVESMNDLRATSGKDFELIDISINPDEKPNLALAKKRTYFRRYLRAGADAGWHFLTGQEADIRKVADAAGFRYKYDPSSKQYAHASGLVILTGDGKVSKYMFGVAYSAEDLQRALAGAGSRRIGSPIENFFLLCFHYNPIGGKYGQLIMNVMRIGGALTLLGLGTLLARMLWRERQAAPGAQPISPG